jgi:hypothetical protein
LIFALSKLNKKEFPEKINIDNVIKEKNVKVLTLEIVQIIAQKI